MLNIRSVAGIALGLVCAASIACGSSGAGTPFTPPPGGGVPDSGGSGIDATVPIFGDDGGGLPFGGGDGSTAGFQVTPTTLHTITVAVGATTPLVTFTATLGGQPANAAWSIDQGSIGSVSGGPASTTSFTPRG